MPDQRRGTVEPHSSSARHAVGGEIREAYGLWSLEYTDDDRWVCVDGDCGAQMIPCCWKWSDEHKSFLTKAGEPAKMPPYFRAEGGHGPNCNVSLDVEPRDHTLPEYRLGVPSDYPGRVRLFRELPGNGRPTPRDLENVPQPENPDQRRARSTYSIREACEYYADHSDQHWRPLRIDGCPGSTYQQCFVRLGTGKNKNVGKNWIFFDQIWLGELIDLKTEPLVLPLLTTVRGEPRRLVVTTSNWVPGYQQEVRDRLLAAIIEVRKAIKESRPERAWIFFYGQEASFNRSEFNVALQPGIDVLVRALPWHWDLQPWNGYRAKRRQSFSGGVTSASPPIDVTEPPAGLPKANASLPYGGEKPVVPPPDALEPSAAAEPVSAGMDTTLSSKFHMDEVAKADPPLPEASPNDFHLSAKDDGLADSVGREEGAEVLVEVQPSNDMAQELEVDLPTSEIFEPVVDDPPPASPTTRAQKNEVAENLAPADEPGRASSVKSADIDLATAAQKAAATKVNGSTPSVPAASEPPTRIGRLRRLISKLNPWRA